MRRLIPEMRDEYYYLNTFGEVSCSDWMADETDLFRFNSGNCFKTEQEVEKYKENLLTRQALKDLALELNNEVEIDWGDYNCKYYIRYDYTTEELGENYAYSYGRLDIYCLDRNFLAIAKDRIGEEKLIKLIKSGV